MKRVITILALLFTFSLGGLLQAQIPTDSLVGYWPFNGNAYDESGNGNAGIVDGASLSMDRFGNENSSYSFDGIDDEIKILISEIPQGAEERTISLWFKIDSLDFGDNIGSEHGALFEYGAYNTNESFGVLIGGNNSTHPALPYFVGQNNDFWCNNEVSIDTWHHQVISYSGTDIDFYIDGVLDISSSINLNTQGVELVIGNIFDNYNNAVSFFAGNIDDIRIYNKVLTTSEIDELFEEVLCSDTTINDTIIHLVSNIEFEAESPKIYFENIDSLSSEIGDCDSIVFHYTKYVFDPNFCTDTTYVTLYDSISVTDTLIIDVVLIGIRTPNTTHTISIYPNPASDYVIINTGEYNPISTYSIEIVNVLGQSVFENLINQQEFQIDVNTFGNYGLYFVKIYDNFGNLIDTRQLILQ